MILFENAQNLAMPNKHVEDDYQINDIGCGHGNLFTGDGGSGRQDGNGSGDGYIIDRYPEYRFKQKCF